MNKFKAQKSLKSYDMRIIGFLHVHFESKLDQILHGAEAPCKFWSILRPFKTTSPEIAKLLGLSRRCVKNGILEKKWSKMENAMSGFEAPKMPREQAFEDLKHVHQ